MRQTVKEYYKNFYIIEDERVRQFLFIGNSDAILVDTGFEDTDVLSAIKEITDNPVKVIMTHGDADHSSGLKAFGECYIHEGDAPMISNEIKINTINEGDYFTAMGFSLEVLHIPGHTNGSIALLDRTRKILLPGDTVQKDGPIFMFGKERNIELYIESLKKLSALKDSIEWIFPCHNACPIEPEYIDYCLEDILAYQANEIKGKWNPTMPCSEYKGKHVSFYI